MSELIRELVKLQEQKGWLEDRALSELAHRLKVPEHRLQSLTTFYPHFRRSAPPEVRVAVCRDLSCELAQGREAHRRLSKGLAEKAGVELVEISCPGRCDQAPAGVIGDIPVCLDDHGAIEQAISDPAGVPFRGWGKGYAEADPYSGEAEHYSTAPRWAKRAPAEAIELLTDAGLRGMGGAAFPTGRKWSLVAEAPGPDKFVICNADESEPGTFKDREILGALPHLVVEGMALAAHA
ncbi:NAD(P)H-dependent oxidoreductase subunit E, partial [Myxococcota bacterium]|nr:NAD(P)H-dependent oxidoreductase subunit E [Myxococcota bacterium]